MKPWEKSMLVFALTMALLLASFFVLIFAMTKVRPNVDRQTLGEQNQYRISAMETQLKQHVVALAETIGERNIFFPDNLDEAARYITAFWESLGYKVTTQPFTVGGLRCKNLSIEITGKKTPEEIIVLGAHYDSVSGSPGANDNASAVAALLEISRLCKQTPQNKTLRLVAFTNEEPPFFQNQSMGSRVYAKQCREQKENIIGMISLETLGYYSQSPKSQQYPPPLHLFYPDKGNFVGIVGNLRSRKLVKTFSRYFMGGIDFPVECVAAFESIPGISWSDHSSFWHYNYPAIMVTDTAPYRYPYYHSLLDTPDKIDYSSLARVTYGVFCATQRMAH